MQYDVEYDLHKPDYLSEDPTIHHISDTIFIKENVDNVKDIGIKLAKKAYHGALAVANYVVTKISADEPPLNGDASIYLLPAFGENKYAIYSPKVAEHKEYTGIIGAYRAVYDNTFRIFEGKDEQLLRDLRESEVTLHYGDLWGDVSIEDAYTELLDKENAYHTNWAIIDFALNLAVGPLPGPGGIFPLARSIDHQNAVLGIDHLREHTTFEKDDFLSKIETVVRTSDSEDDAYFAASRIAEHYGHMDIAKLYAEKKIKTFTPRENNGEKILKFTRKWLDNKLNEKPEEKEKIGDMLGRKYDQKNKEEETEGEKPPEALF